jgi:pantoate--beta-alanine ligase
VEMTASPDQFRELCDEARRAGRDVGFVPTMGDLHPGHTSLLKRARKECAFVALSVFVNPLQFDSPADLEAYPRVLDKDKAVAASLGIDLLFAPGERAMYASGQPEVTIDPGPLGERLEGTSRPGHFRGVLTVVAKLFNLAGRCRAYFGEKDAQQLALVRRMVRDLDVPVNVISCPTVREPDGLAVSSRNARLSQEERRAAPVLFEALSDAATAFRQGERRAMVLRASMARRIGAEPRAKLDYAAVGDDTTWDDLDEITGPARALVAARVGATRLIDNLLLPWPKGGGMHNTSPGGR